MTDVLAMGGGEHRPETWAQVRVFVHRACGVELADDQAYLLDARLGSLARQRNASIDALVSGAVADPQGPLAIELIEAMTTHETYFFRDPTFWTAFEQVVMPRLLQVRAAPLRFWSAACSHGQEAYTLAMLLEEKWPALAPSISIVASDVSPLAVERAREGRFSGLEVNRGLGAARLLRHFQQDDGGFRVKAALRERITFTVHNLLGPPPSHGPYDAVFCRNVLIYFNDVDRKLALTRVFDATHFEAFVGLGSTEYVIKPQACPGWYLNERLVKRGDP